MSLNDFELIVVKEKHAAFFDRKKQYIASFVFKLVRKEKEKVDVNQQQPEIFIHDDILAFQIWIENAFTLDWKSQYLTIREDEDNHKHYGDIPFSLETFLQMYKDPRQSKFIFELKEGISPQQAIQQEEIGKLIIQTVFRLNPFIIPIRTQSESQKSILIIIQQKAEVNTEFVLCSGKIVQETWIEEIQNFENIYPDNSFGYKLFKYEIPKVVESKYICIFVAQVQFKKVYLNNIQIVVVVQRNREFETMPNFKDYLFKLSLFMELKTIMVIQNVKTDIKQAEGIVFYEKNCYDLYERLFRSYLYSKIKDEWIIYGMVNYKPNSRYFHEKWLELCELVTKGEQFSPIIEPEYSLDEVWQLKAIVVYQIMANLTHQYEKLTNILLGSLKNDRRMTTKSFIRTIKNKHGIQLLKPIYLEQFINRTGISKIYYQFSPIRRENKIKIKLRQKSLQAASFEQYNHFRIRLEEMYNCKSQLIQKIIEKNKIEDTKKKQITGPLLVPVILKSNPFIKKNKLPIIIAETNEIQFQQEEYEIKLQKQKITKELISCRSKLRKIINKKSELDRQGSKLPTWMKIDPSHTFLFCCKNQNLKDSKEERDNRRSEIIIEKQLQLQKNQMELLKVIQSLKDSKIFHKNITIVNKLCSMLEVKELNTTSLDVREQILSIFPTILTSSQDRKPWQTILFLLKLYEPICYDRSLDGHRFKIAILQCLSRLKYRKQYSTYFEQFHRILLSISRDDENHFGMKEEIQFRKNLYKAMIKWKTKYTIHVLKEIETVCLIYMEDVSANQEILEVIIQKSLKYIQSIECDEIEEKIINKLKSIFSNIIKSDKTNRLFLCEYNHELAKKEKQLTVLNFFIYFYEELEKIRVTKFSIYETSIKYTKDLLIKNKKKYGLEMQISLLNPDQNYYIAERLWEKMTTAQALYYPGIRLYWMKIYRIFYFYFTPVCVIHKIKQTGTKTDFFSMNITEQQKMQILANLKDFAPDIEWFSGYDISYNKKNESLKEQDKQQNERNERKKQKLPRAELVLQQNNIMARHIQKNPDKEVNWIELSKKALEIVIQSHENNNTKMEIISHLRSIKKKLKRGNMPKGYTFQDLQEQTIKVLEDGEQSTQTIKELFEYSKRILQKVVRQHDTKITLPADIILGTQ